MIQWLVCGQRQPFLAHDVDETALAGIEHMTVAAEPVGLRGLIERDHSLITVVRNQDPGLFKRFANGRHPIGQAPALDTQRPARNLIRHAGAQGLQLGGFVLCIKRAAGKNVRARHKPRLEVALHHQHF